MKALVLEGVNQSLKVKEVADPKPKDNEVVVDLKAAALNHRDLWIQKGLYPGLKFPIILGSDGAGVVSEIGKGADSSWVGKEVIINPALDWGNSEACAGDHFRILGLPDNGTWAEKIVIAQSQLAPKPAHLDYQHAAALPLAGLTAYRVLFSRAGLKAGQKVLVTGVGGGVAVFVLLFAVAAGAEVYVTSGSDAKVQRAKELGAVGGANYKAQNWDQDLEAQLKESQGFDVIIDSAGGDGFSKLIGLAKPGGHIAFFGATRGNPPELDMRQVFWKQLSILGSTMGSPKDFANMLKLVNEHKIVPLACDHVFSLEQGNEALATMDQSQQFGKIVLTT